MTMFHAIPYTVLHEIYIKQSSYQIFVWINPTFISSAICFRLNYDYVKEVKKKKVAVRKGAEPNRPPVTENALNNAV